VLYASCLVQAGSLATQPPLAVTVAGEMIKSLLHSCRAAGSGVNLPLPADAALRVRGSCQMLCIILGIFVFDRIFSGAT